MPTAALCRACPLLQSTHMPMWFHKLQRNALHGDQHNSSTSEGAIHNNKAACPGRLPVINWHLSIPRTAAAATVTLAATAGWHHL